MANPSTPVIKVDTATSVGQTLDWSREMAACAIISLGPDDVWVKFDVEGTTITQADGNGQVRLQPGAPLNLPDIRFFKIGIRCLAAQTAFVQVVAVQKDQA